MAFPRIQGNKILILHSIRKGKQIKQEKLHVFDSFADAGEVVNSDSKWSLFCDSLRMPLKGRRSINDRKLRTKIKQILEEHKTCDKSDQLNEAAIQLVVTLQSFEKPLQPYQLKSLERAKDSLNLLRKIIEEKLLLVPKSGGETMQSLDYVADNNQLAEEILDQGLELYWQGKWDEAKREFFRGLQVDPDHVDLLVHAGLSELIEENYHLALSYFDKAIELGKQHIDIEIANNPEQYVKRDNLEKWAADKECRLADECPDRDTEKCKDCEENPENKAPNLYSYLEFRPFFRALTNKAVTLQKMKRYQEAIEVLELCHSYQDLWGTYNMIGICHLNLGNIEQADKWYIEMLWPDAYYVKALICWISGRQEDALRYLLTGVTHNWHIAHMLIGRDQPETTRYIGSALPDRLKASEFIHEHGTIFKKYSGFRAMVRCVLDDVIISELLEDLKESKTRRKEERDYRMGSHHWQLLFGNMDEEFLSLHVPRLLASLNDRSGEYWLAKKHEIISVKVLEKKTQNWLVELEDCSAKPLYFRPNYYVELVQEGDIIRICVSKSWYYRKRLFISGEIEQ
jgi:tetratricopeptide (TPR) repeat protein